MVGWFLVGLFMVLLRAFVKFRSFFFVREVSLLSSCTDIGEDSSHTGNRVTERERDGERER